MTPGSLNPHPGMLLERTDKNTYLLTLTGDGGVPCGLCWMYRTLNGVRYASTEADAVLGHYYEEGDGAWPTVVYSRQVSADDNMGLLKGSPAGPDAPNLLPALKRLFAVALAARPGLSAGDDILTTR